MKQECASCAALRQEFQKLQQISEQRARHDHEQCVMMFQQMQELVKLNQAKTRDLGSRSRLVSSGDESECTKEVTGSVSSAGSEQQILRLQTIIVQQAKELETLRQNIEATAIGLYDNQLEGDQSSPTLLSECEEGDAIDSDYKIDIVRSDRDLLAAEKYTNQLRKLPLTSLHAQLKGKDLQLLHLQQLINKMENRFGQLIDRKRSMTQTFQQTARTQQAHLKKYLAYIRQQAEEKKALERQLRELKQYVDVLEKKIVSSSLRTSKR